MSKPASCVTLLVIASLLIVTNSLPAQPKRTKIVVDGQMKDSFSFTNQWAYYWLILKDESGKFFKASSEPLIPTDTAHLYFTANCTTNIQGGYNIRYCEAQKSKNGIQLIFKDGLPAYGSTFYCYVGQDSFYFKPRVSYPMFIPGERLLYVVTKQQLILQKPVYTLGDTLTGYINVEFIETASAPRHKPQKTKLYLKGYIKTPVISFTRGKR